MNLALLLAVVVAPQDTTIQTIARRAVEEAQKELGPRAQEIKVTQGIAHVRAGDGPGAKFCFASVLATDPTNAGAIANLGFTLLRLKDVESAGALLAAGAKLHPDCAEIRNNYAHVLLQTGKTEDALKEFDAAARLQPRHPQIDYSRAWILDRQGRKRDAKEILEPIVERYAQHEAAHGLLKRVNEDLGKDAPKDDIDSSRFPGEKTPSPEQTAQFVADMLKRYDELSKEHAQVREEIAGLWTVEDEARAQQEDEREEKRLADLTERAMSGDQAAAEEFGEALTGRDLWLKERAGRVAACGDFATPKRELLEGMESDFTDPNAEHVIRVEELRGMKDLTRDEALEAVNLLAYALSTRLSAEIWKAQFEQHARICPPAMRSVRTRLQETRRTMKQIHAEVEKKLEELRQQYEADLLGQLEYERKVEEVLEDHRQRCTKLVVQFRHFVATTGSQWKASVDGHRARVLEMAAQALDESARASSRFYSLFGCNAPPKEYLAMLTPERLFPVLSPMGPDAAGKAAVAVAAGPDGPGLMQDRMAAIARAHLDRHPPPVRFTVLGIQWSDPKNLVDYWMCLVAFNTRDYQFECPQLGPQFSWFDIVGSLGVDASLTKVDLKAVEISVGMDGTVSVTVGQGFKGGVSLNPFTGKVGMKLGYGYSLGGLGAGAFITLDNDKGLGWVAEVEVGKSTITVAEDTLVELAPQE
ncbi:MAG: tetratricopeptide repeat protein [Planctomycetes bacterium]|nr:tetratricopeptide repeat protein [Planctomycetota bacterium]